jgi:hypothetical protein
VIKENRELENMHGMDERYELRQLPTCNMYLLEYNFMRNNVESICNVYL